MAYAIVVPNQVAPLMWDANLPLQPSNVNNGSGFPNSQNGVGIGQLIPGGATITGFGQDTNDWGGDQVTEVVDASNRPAFKVPCSIQVGGAANPGGLVCLNGINPAQIRVTSKVASLTNAACFRVQALIAWATNPLLAGMCQSDAGLWFYPATRHSQGGTVFDTTSPNSAGQAYGFGIQLDQASGHLHFISQTHFGFPNNPFAQNTDMGAPQFGYLQPFLIDVLIQSALQGADGSVSVSIDGVQKASAHWGAGGTLPAYSSGGINTTAFQAEIINSTGGRNGGVGIVANPDLLVYGFRARCGSLQAVTLEN